VVGASSKSLISHIKNGEKTAMSQQEKHSPYLSPAQPTAAVWIGSAFCAALGLAALVLAALGPGERGTHVDCKQLRGFPSCYFGQLTQPVR